MYKTSEWSTISFSIYGITTPVFCNDHHLEVKKQTIIMTHVVYVECLKNITSGRAVEAKYQISFWNILSSILSAVK